MNPSIRRLLVRVLRTYLLLVVVVFLGQRWMIYQPFRASESQMILQADAGGLTPWKDDSGQIVGWRNDVARKTKPANKLIVFGGNGGNAIYRDFYVAAFESLNGGSTWEVFLFEYPGYGARPGKMNREVFNSAGHAAVKELLAMDDRPLYLLGESLGSGVACEVAAKEPAGVRGLALVTPFARLADVAQSAIPFMPAALMLRDRWDNLVTLPQSRGPVAVIIAGCDEVVGCEQGEQVFAFIRDRPKQRWFFPEAKHNTLDTRSSAAWWGEVSEFLTNGR